MKILAYYRLHGRDNCSADKARSFSLHLVLFCVKKFFFPIFSLSSLSRLSESGTKNKKAKKLIQQLEIDKRLLEDRVRDLNERNRRGRYWTAAYKSKKMTCA